MTDPAIPSPGEIPPGAGDDRFAGRFEVKDGVRRHVARGTIINAGFLVGLTALGFLKGFLVAAFLTAEDYGLWGILVISIATLAVLSERHRRRSTSSRTRRSRRRPSRRRSRSSWGSAGSP